MSIRQRIAARDAEVAEILRKRRQALNMRAYHDRQMTRNMGNNVRFMHSRSKRDSWERAVYAYNRQIHALAPTSLYRRLRAP
jgi:hypothetical protein